MQNIIADTELLDRLPTMKKIINSWQRGLSYLHDGSNSTSKSTKYISIGPPGGIGTEYSQSISAG